MRIPKYILFVGLAGFFMLHSPSWTAAQSTNVALARVKTIFVASPLPESMSAQDKALQTRALVDELKRLGIEVVADGSLADAVLTGGAFELEVVLHGDGTDPDRVAYSYQLASPNGSVIWNHKFKFVTRRNPADEFHYAARRMAARLRKDREAAIKRGARN